MPLLVNLRHLENRNVVLQGELPVSELDLDTRDPMIVANLPLAHDLEVQLLDESLIVRGVLGITLDCQCVRCLKAFQHRVELADWTCHLALKGEEAVPVVSDCVDLTPHLREDIFLAFPAHPVCNPRCAGLTGAESGAKKKKNQGQTKPSSSAWSALDK